MENFTIKNHNYILYKYNSGTGDYIFVCENCGSKYFKSTRKYMDLWVESDENKCIIEIFSDDNIVDCNTVMIKSIIK